MRNGLERLMVVASAVVSLAAMKAVDVRRAYPTVIVFAGEALGHRLALRDVRDIGQLMGALAGAVDRSDTLGRTPIEVAMFYGRSSFFSSKPIDSIPLLMADARARYYPPLAGKPALWIPSLTLNGVGRAWSITDAGLEILSRNGVNATANAAKQ